MNKWTYGLLLTVLALSSAACTGRIHYDDEGLNNIFSDTTVPVLPGDKPASEVGVNLAVAHQQQEQTNWCWAAVGQMTVGHYGDAVPLCQVVQDTLSSRSADWPAAGADCCDASQAAGEACNRPFYETVAAEMYGVESVGIRRVLTEEEIRVALTNDRLVAIEFFWEKKTDGHVMLISGYNAVSSGWAFTVNDSGATQPNFVDYGTLLQKYENTEIDDVLQWKSSVVFLKP